MANSSADWKYYAEKAKQCRTKEKWETLFFDISQSPPKSYDSAALRKIFLMLSKDDLSVNYDHKIWSLLLTTSFQAWDNNLALGLAEFCEDIPNPNLLSTVASVYLQSQLPEKARSVAKRALKLKTVTESEKGKLSLTICNSFADQNNYKKALSELKKLEKDTSLMSDENFLAEFWEETARLYFTLGDYDLAGEKFELSSNFYKKSNIPSKVASLLFNAAAAYDNGASRKLLAITTLEDQEIIFEKIKNLHIKAESCLLESKNISEQHQFKTPLSSCLDFLGVRESNLGSPSKALEYFKSSQSLGKEKETTLWYLHNLSMQINVYLDMGQLFKAQRVWTTLCTLLKQNQSLRFQGRYIGIEAEILWENQEFEKSYELLKAYLSNLKSPNELNLEDLGCLSYFIERSLQLGKFPNQRFADKDILKLIPLKKCDQHDKGLVLMANNETLKAFLIFKRSIDIANKTGNEFSLYKLKNLIAALKCIAMDSSLNIHRYEYLNMLNETLTHRGKSKFDIFSPLFTAAFAYKEGKFEESINQLKIAEKIKHAGISETLLIDNLLDKVLGNPVVDFEMPFKSQLLTTYKDMFYRQSFKYIGEDKFEVNKSHIVNYENKPIMSGFLQYLLNKPNYSASEEEIQREFWQQDTNEPHWRQKITNVIHRLKKDFSPLLSPLIVRDEQIKLNCDEIIIENTF